MKQVFASLSSSLMSLERGPATVIRYLAVTVKKKNQVKEKIKKKIHNHC